MMLKYKCLVLDHDDTVVQSEASINYPFFCYILDQFRPGAKITMQQYVDGCFRLGFADMCRQWYGFNDQELKDEYRGWMDYVKTHIPPPYPGIRELLEKLKADGHRLYVATSKPEWMSIEILEHFDLAKYFDMICGASTDFSRNSKEAVITHLLEECGAQENPIMVGDTAYDVIGAKEHGIPTIGVDWGYGRNEDMEKAGAIAIAYTVDELYNLLK